MSAYALSAEDMALAEALGQLLHVAPGQVVSEALAVYALQVHKAKRPLAIAAARKGLSLSALARACGVDPSMLSHVARGAIAPSAKLTARIAYHLEMTPQEVADITTKEHV